MAGDGDGEDSPGTRLEDIDWAPVLPRLQRFFGSSPSEWRRMPLPLLSIHMEQMPAIKAEESMRIAEAVAVGNGSLKKAASRRITRDWQREVRQESKSAGPRPKPAKEQFQAQLAMLNIGFQEVPA